MPSSTGSPKSTRTPPDLMNRAGSMMSTLGEGPIISDESFQRRLSSSYINDEMRWRQGALEAELEAKNDDATANAPRRRSLRRESLIPGLNRQNVSGRSSMFFKGHNHSLSTISHFHRLELEFKRIAKLPLKMKHPLHLPQGLDDFPDDLVDGTCFGEIIFGRRPEKHDAASHQWPPPAKYCCLSDATNVNDVFKLLDSGWELKRPSVLISITGSAQDIELEPKLEHEFAAGLAAAASCTHGWVVTSGTDAGVMSIVGKALKERNLHANAKDLAPVIGIVPWGTTMHRRKLYNAEVRQAIDDLLGEMEHLERQRRGEQDPEVIQRIWDNCQNSLQSARIPYLKKAKNTKQEAALETGHTHFILVDDGTEGEWLGEIEMRASIEKKICEAHQVPGLQVVVQGSWGTLKTVTLALEKDMQVVLVADSGGCASVLAEILDPLLLRAAELPLEGFVRKKAVEEAIESYQNHREHRLLELMRTAPPATREKRLKEAKATLVKICINLERFTAYSFQSRLVKSANKKAVQRSFDQVLLDAIVLASKLDADKAEEEEQGRRSQIAPMRQSTDGVYHGRPPNPGSLPAHPCFVSHLGPALAAHW